MTPEIDSICNNTLDYVRIKQSLTSQQFAISQDAEQLRHTIDILNQHLEETLNEQMVVESELEAINRHLDSLTPKRPDGPRPKVNIIDILSERLSFHGSYGLNINQLALSNHEQEHVSNAYKDAEMNNGKVIRASVAIHTAICPECGRTYVSGGTTTTQIKYYNEDNQYQKDLKLQDSTKYAGKNVDYGC